MPSSEFYGATAMINANLTIPQSSLPKQLKKKMKGTNG